MHLEEPKEPSYRNTNSVNLVNGVLQVHRANTNEKTAPDDTANGGNKSSLFLRDKTLR